VATAYSAARAQRLTRAYTSAGTSGAQTYRLIANPTALIPHVGKKVELTGTLDDSGTKPPEPSAAPEVNALTLKVESGKIVAASCSE